MSENNKDQRCCHRIFTEVNLAIGNAKPKLQQVNVSASGIAFVLDPIFHSLGVVDSVIEVSFSLFGIEFDRLSIKVVRVDQNEERLMIGACYIGVPQSQKEKINTAIEEQGGYENGDLESKLSYLSWYAPNIAKEIEARTKSTLVGSSKKADDFLSDFKSF